MRPNNGIIYWCADSHAVDVTVAVIHNHKRLFMSSVTNHDHAVLHDLLCLDY